MKLFINDIQIDLPSNFKIARTKQVNDIGTLSNRQANYTQKIKLPKTKKNKTTFKNLGSPADVSRVPYERNNVFLYNNNGECEIYNGWAVITNTNKFYNITIYDGSIDFYKAIENKNLTDIDLSALTHTKNTENVVNSWNTSSPFRYIIADYNGKLFFDDNGTEVLNIDYLVPSVNVKWLWDRVFTFFGFTYTGNVFQIEQFTNLWMTFPKGINNSTTDPTIIYNNTNFETTPVPILEGGLTKFYIEHINPAPTLGSFLSDDVSYLVAEDSTYRFELTGSITVDIEVAPSLILANQPATVFFKIANATDFSLTNTVDTQLQQGQIIRWFANYPLFNNDQIVSINYSNDFELTIKKLEGEIINFDDAFIDFKITDFFNEILWRFNLTPFKDKYTNNIEFLTLAQRLQNTNYYNWSDRFVEEVDEKYIYSNYGQENNLRYKYNDKESDFNDGIILIDNVNLNDSVDVIRSSIYSPNNEKTILFTEPFNVYPLWNKEANEGTSTIDVKYKSLDKRYYFLRSEDFTHTGVIGSEFLSETDNYTSFPRERYTRLPFSEIVEDYYLPIQGILNDTRVVIASVYLDDNLVNNIDFRRLIFVKQLSNYYILNKIPNYISKGFYNVELIRVKYSSIVTVQNTFATITFYNSVTLELAFTISNYTLPNLILQTSSDNGVTWFSLTKPATSPISTIIGSGRYVRLKHFNLDLYSNIYIVP